MNLIKGVINMGMEEAKKVKDWVEEAVLEVINSRIPTKFYIYNSSVFTVPYDTVARIIAVGKGGAANNSGNVGGGGGGTAVKLAKLKKGDKITITLNDEKTTAACKDWAISGYNGGDGYFVDVYSYLPGPGGAAEGGGKKSSSTGSLIVGNDIQLIAGGSGGSRYSDGGNNAISKGGKKVQDGHGGGGASYFGGNGCCSYYDYQNGSDGGDGLYGGGNGGPGYGTQSNSTTIIRGGNGGNSIYGYGGKGGRSTTKYKMQPVGGNGGYGGIRGGKGGLAYWDSNGSGSNATSPTKTKGQDGESGIYYPMFNTPSQLPIGSGQGAGCYSNVDNGEYRYSPPGVGAVIIELGEDRFLDTYV